MANYVFSYRVPSDYAPGPETGSEWEAWFGTMGSALVSVWRKASILATHSSANGGRPAPAEVLAR